MYLYIDIETIPDQTPGSLEKILATVQPPGNYKKSESIAKWREESAPAIAEEKWLKTALNGASGEIISIAWAIDDGEINCLHRELGFLEVNLLERFFEAAFPEPVRQPTWIGHNLEWDLRFLWHRCVVNDVLKGCMLPVQSRERTYCTMREWAGYRDTISLDNLAQALGIEGKIANGSQVWEMVKAGLYDELRSYNKDDVRVTREIHRRMQFSSAA